MNLGAFVCASVCGPVAIFGDMGNGTLGNAMETHRQLLSMMGDFDFVLHAGDISYAGA